MAKGSPGQEENRIGVHQGPGGKRQARQSGRRAFTGLRAA